MRPANVAALVRETGVREVHLRAAVSTPSAAVAGSVYDSGSRDTTSGAVVAQVVAAVREVAA